MTDIVKELETKAAKITSTDPRFQTGDDLLLKRAADEIRSLRAVNVIVSEFLSAATEAAEILREEAEIIKASFCHDGVWSDDEEDYEKQYQRMHSLADILTPHH